MTINVKAIAPEPNEIEAPFFVRRLGRHLGAEITGLDLKQGFTQETFDAFLAALTAHKVVVMRGQNLDTKQHVEISRWFGELEVHPFRPEGAFPEIMVLDNHKDNPVLSTDVWHSDTTFRIKPTKYTILRSQIIPELGGDTVWCDMQAVYNGFSERFRAFIDPLQARHDFKNFRALFTKSDDDQKRLGQMENLYPNPLHPVVRTHPLSGRKCIYVNRQFTLYIDGLGADESDAVLELLYKPVHTPEYQFRHCWSEGDIVFWDNMSTQHYAANDYYPNRRRMERTAVCGDEPY
ncbi:MAG: TauD/TfdA family dioxygenase [Beijerinckiaceae bacterium]|jgi:taurine dioxygenase|nr:TauD/TfdA family dioxygenase [Beijerinckiaceae bacterium]